MMKKISIRRVSISDEVLGQLPASLAHRLNVLPVAFEEDRLTVAVSPELEDPIDVLDQIEARTGSIADAVVSDSAEELRTAIRRYYPGASEREDSGSASALFQRLLNRALQLRASDIHICPEEEGADIRLRIDGRLRSDRRINANMLTELTAVVKIAADLDIAEKRTPLDGSINIRFGEDEEISLRVATIPTLYGEHITLRLLTQDHGEELERIESLGMSELHLRLFLDALADPNGIVILSGPTGSGKTTTLYAALRHLRAGGMMHLVSIEDPVEKPVEGVTQIRIDAESDRLTFHKALRSVLRHDPDVIMIGEIRDGETGDIAVKSALTGHLVLSTLHTNSATGVLTRLMNIGVAPFLVASTLRLAIAQRLVRVPCMHCAEKRRPTERECREFGWDADDETLLVPEPRGCSLCGGKGYSGRLGIYEMIPLDHELRKMILNGCDEQDFSAYCFGARKLPSLRADGAAKILQGLTTPAEVRSVTAEF